MQKVVVEHVRNGSGNSIERSANSGPKILAPMNASNNKKNKGSSPSKEASKQKRKESAIEEQLGKIEQSILMNGKSIARAIETSSKQNNAMASLQKEITMRD